MHRGSQGRGRHKNLHLGARGSQRPREATVSSETNAIGSFLSTHGPRPSNARRGVLGAAIVAGHAAQPEQGGKDAEGRLCVWAWACQTEEEARKKAASNVIY